MTLDRVRWGVIGCGQIAVDKMLPAMRAADHVQLVAAADSLPERRALSGVRSYADYRELLADPQVDAVYIALPTGMHLEAVLAAAQAGKAILCEKPLGRSASEVERMTRAAQAHGTPLMTAYMSRFGDVFRQARAMLHGGEIGDATFVYANFSYPALGPYPPGAPGGWRWTDPQGGGPLLDIGVYLAFGLRELLGSTITAVHAGEARTVAPPEAAVPDTNLAWFCSANGVPGVFAATFSHQECRISVYGTRGRLDLTDCFAQTPSGRLEVTVDGTTTVSVAPDGLPHFEHYRREIEHFSQALLTDAPYQPSAEDALADARLLDALKGTPA